MSTSLSTQRIEAFSDGVFSIAITLLVLELQIPVHGNGAHLSLYRELAQLWPAYLGYVMSFVMIGIYWANHHYIFQLYRSTNHVFNLLNIFFLMCISFLPFPAAVLSQRFEHPEDAHTAVLFYAFGLLLPAVGFTAMWLYASAGHRLVDKQLSSGFIRHLSAQYLSACAIYISAMVLTHWTALGGLSICIALTLLFLLPSRTPEYTRAPRQGAEHAG